MTEKVKNAAILLMGLGDQAAGEILKSMSPREVRAIIDAINNIESVTEDDVQKAMSEFFTETHSVAGIDLTKKDHLKNHLISTSGNVSFLDTGNVERDKWLELIVEESIDSIVNMVQDEHPQIIASIVIILFNNISSEFGTKLIKSLPKDTQSKVFKRMTSFDYISKFAVDVLADYFSKELGSKNKYNQYAVNGLETVANIISYMDSETEREIMGEISSEDKILAEKIQDKMFPFSRIADLDKRSLQVLLSEINNEDLVLALKGVDDRVKDIFLQNMSSKSADILREDIESKGPVKIAQVLDAQKNIIRVAKKLNQEEAIILASRNNPEVVY